MIDDLFVKIHYLKALGKCPPLTTEMQARQTWEALDPNNENVLEAKRLLVEKGFRED